MKSFTVLLVVLLLFVLSVGVTSAMTFEQFRMLSSGMTQAQVAMKVGSPNFSTIDSCSAGPSIRGVTAVCIETWTYQLSDGWMVTLTFSGGVLQNIRNEKP